MRRLNDYINVRIGNEVRPLDNKMVVEDSKVFDDNELVYTGLVFYDEKLDRVRIAKKDISGVPTFEDLAKMSDFEHVYEQINKPVQLPDFHEYIQKDVFDKFRQDKTQFKYVEANNLTVDGDCHVNSLKVDDECHVNKLEVGELTIGDLNLKDTKTVTGALTFNTTNGKIKMFFEKGLLIKIEN